MIEAVSRHLLRSHPRQLVTDVAHDVHFPHIIRSVSQADREPVMVHTPLGSAHTDHDDQPTNRDIQGFDDLDRRQPVTQVPHTARWPAVFITHHGGITTRNTPVEPSPQVPIQPPLKIHHVTNQTRPHLHG